MTSSIRWLFASSLVLCLAFTACAHSPAKEKASADQTAAAQETQTVVTVPVFNLEPTVFEKKVTFPAELVPFEEVDVFPKVEGFIQNIFVDRGSSIRQGEVLATVIAPELEAQVAQAQSKVKMANAQETEARAKYFSEKEVYERLKKAAEVPGVISENELEVAKMTAQAALSHVHAVAESKQADIAGVQSLKKIQSYLSITAPITGVVTERDLHPGALVGPSGAGATKPIFKISELSKLRLDVSIPERFYETVRIGMKVPFTVSTYPDRTFYGVIERPAYSVDKKNRTETVELDVTNPERVLSPGMYAEVKWPIERNKATFVVPSTAVISTTERTFVIVDRNGRADWVNVHTGYTDGDNVEVFGNLKPGDKLVLKGTDEIRDGSMINPQLVSMSTK